MTQKVLTPRGFHGLLWSLVTVIILADQATKAYFVWLLGIHDHKSFTSFLGEYFSIFMVDPAAGGIVQNFASGKMFKPLIWVWEPWIAWQLTTNTGAAYSLFEGNSYFLSFVSLAMATLLWFIWWRKFRNHTPMTWALGGIIGGALGNFIDRFRLHEVVDFIDVNIPLIGRVFPKLGDPYDFPIFNIADSTAVCGTLALAIYLIVSDFKGMRKTKKAGDAKIDPFPEGPQLDADAKAEARELAGKYAERRTAEVVAASSTGNPAEAVADEVMPKSEAKPGSDD